MKWQQHSELRDKHSFLSASKYHWVNYDPEHLLETFDNSMDAALGTRLHNLAAECIRLGVKLENNSQTLNLYVNTCIGYRMRPEQTLFYSMNAFGTADAISFGPNPQDPTGPWILRIFDLKNGLSPASPTQLIVYAAYFCLEYKIKPLEIAYDLRIFQNDAIEFIDFDVEDVGYVMSRIVEYSKLIDRRREDMQL